MSINYNVTGERRKALVKALGEILALDAVYQGAPSFAYKIGSCTVDKNGVLNFGEGVNDSAMSLLVNALKERGFEAENPDIPPDYHDLQMTEREELGLGRERRDPPGEDGMQASDIPEPATVANDNLVIEVSREGFTDEAIANLRKIIASKQTLIEKALGLDDLPFNDDCLAVEVKEDKLRFPWFTLMGIDSEFAAYDVGGYDGCRCNCVRS